MVHKPFEFDCCECGRHIVDVSGQGREPPLCAECLHVPGWFRDPQLARILDPNGDCKPPQGGNSMKRGDKVTVTCDGETRTGEIVLCSANRESLMVRLDDGLPTRFGFYIGFVALSLTDGGYRELIGGRPVEIAVKRAH